MALATATDRFRGRDFRFEGIVVVVIIIITIIIVVLVITSDRCHHHRRHHYSFLLHFQCPSDIESIKLEF